MLRPTPDQVDLLVLGAGWTSEFLIPLLEKKKILFAATTTNGRDGTIPFKYDPESEDEGQFKRLPTAVTVVISFPLKGKGQSSHLTKLYQKTHEGSKPQFIQLGATSIWKGAGWQDENSPYDTTNSRAIAEDELMDVADGAVLDLAGLYGGARQPRNWVDWVVKSKAELKAKGALHLIHGEDVSRAIIALHHNFTPAKRWLLCDLHTYDWWDLVQDWAVEAGRKAEAHDNLVDEAEIAKQKQLQIWVGELMEEEGVRALPRDTPLLGRVLDACEMKSITDLLIAAALVRAQDIEFISDPGVFGPPLEVQHAYYGQWPTGIAVSSTGRKFSNFPGGLDPTNTYNGSNDVFTVGELTSLTNETAYPSLEMNHPPGGAINYTTNPPTGASYPDYLIGVQSVVVDPLDRLWILDTGRVLTPDGTLVYAAYGGPKLVGVDLNTNEVFKTILFPQTVAYADSYLNDVRFDLRAEVSDSGEGVAYITDSSSEGRNGIIIVDLGSGESWRHLELTQPVRSQSQFLPFIWGQPIYYALGGQPYSHFPLGSDGIALSADGERLFWGPLGSRYLFSCATSLLRQRGQTSELLAEQGVTNHGEKGASDGFETDSNGYMYVGNNEGNAVNLFNPQNGTTVPFVRDPRINWVDTMSVASDGYLYFTVNQINFSPASYPGTDRRVRPFALFKALLPDGGTKVQLK
ncbi:major royal jelly protein [Seiridium cupressi]